MKATVSFNGTEQSVVMELSMAEARALEKSLGTDSTGACLERGLTPEESQRVYHVFDKLNDVVVAAKALEGI